MCAVYLVVCHCLLSYLKVHYYPLHSCRPFCCPLVWHFYTFILLSSLLVSSISYHLLLTSTTLTFPLLSSHILHSTSELIPASLFSHLLFFSLSLDLSPPLLHFSSLHPPLLSITLIFNTPWLWWTSKWHILIWWCKWGLVCVQQGEKRGRWPNMALPNPPGANQR